MYLTLGRTWPSCVEDIRSMRKTYAPIVFQSFFSKMIINFPVVIETCFNSGVLKQARHFVGRLSDFSTSVRGSGGEGSTADNDSHAFSFTSSEIILSSAKYVDVFSQEITMFGKLQLHALTCVLQLTEL